MARAVRKVSRATTRTQKKETKFNKKWLIICLSAILLIGIGLGVGLGIYFGTKSDNTYVSDKIYFNEEVTVNDEKVTFNKENYQSIIRYLDKGTNQEDIFIFVYDGNQFYADEKDEDNYDKNYSTLIDRLAQLQFEVNKAKNKGASIELYIIDVAVDSSVNAGIFSDSKFGSLNSEDQVNYEPAFIYLKDGKYEQKIEYSNDSNNKESHIISTATWTDIATSSIKYAINYIQTL